MKFGEKLLQANIIDRAQLNAALRHLRETRQRIGEALLELGYVSEEVLLKHLAQEFSTRFVSSAKLARLEVAPQLLDLVPLKLAEERLVFPLMLDPINARLGIVSCEPQNKEAAKEVSIVSGIANVDVYVATHDAIRALIKKHYLGDIHAFRNLLHPPEAPSPPEEVREQEVSEELITLEKSSQPRSSGPAVQDLDSIGQAEKESDFSRRPVTSTWAKQIETVRGGSLLSDNDFIETLNILVGLLELQRPQLQGHSARVARWTKAISEKLDLSQRDIHFNIIAAYLHDLGKRFPPHLTLLSIQQSQEHRQRAQRYYLTPARLFDGVHLPRQVNQITTHLYEQFDGNGIPEKLSGNGIPMGARILSLVDAFEDLVGHSQNPFGEVLTPLRALEQVTTQADRLFDPKLVGLLSELLQAEAKPSTMPTSEPWVLIADPDAAATATLENLLQENGFKVLVARDSLSAIQIGKEQPVIAAIVEMRMQPADGFTVLEQIRASKSISTYLVTQDPSTESIQHAFALGATDFMAKPVAPEVLLVKLLKQVQPKSPNSKPPTLDLSQDPTVPAPFLEVQLSNVPADGSGVVIEVENVEPPLDRGPGSMEGMAPSHSGISIPNIPDTKGQLSGVLEGKPALALIKALVAKKHTGNLSLRLGDKKGEIRFDCGQLYQAIVGEAQGEEAFLELASWRDCVYQFDPNNPPKTRAIKTPTAQLLQVASMSLE